MPPVGAAIGAVVSAIAASTVLTNIAIGIGLSLLSRAFMPKAEKPKAPGMREDTTLTGGTNPEAFVLGTAAVSGAFAAPPMSSGADGETPNAFLDYVIEVAGIPGHELIGYLINDEQVEIIEANPNANRGRRIGGRYEGHAWIKYYDGTQTEADSFLLSRYFGSSVRPWSSRHIGEDLCYAHVSFKYNREIYQGFPRVGFVLRGLPVYDPRKDSTVGGSGHQRWDDPSTWAHSDNPVVLIYNILRGITFPSGEVWGGGIPGTDLPYDIWASQMDKCDEEVANPGGGMEPRFRGGMEVYADDEPFSVIEDLLKTCFGTISEAGGVWTIHIGEPALPVFAFTDDDILADSSEEYQPFPSIEQVFNGIEATYPDPEAGWKARDAAPIYNPEWEAEDDGRRLVASVQFDACPYAAQVQRLMHTMLRDHRRMRSHIVTLPPDASVLQVMDTVAWSSEHNGYDAKLFQVHEASVDLVTRRTEVSLREVDPGDHEDMGEIVLPPPPDNRPQLPVVQAVPGWFVEPYIIRDENSDERRAAVKLSWWPEEAEDARGIRWAFRLHGETGDGEISAIHEVHAGGAIVEKLPDTRYEVRARLVVDRPTEWSNWVQVRTPDVRLTLPELSQDIRDRLEELKDWIDSGFGELPDDLADLDRRLTEAIEQEVQDRVEAIGNTLDEIRQEVQDRRDAVQGVIDDLVAESEDRIKGLNLTAERWRDHRDRIRALAAQVIELAASDHEAREQIRRSLTVQLGDMGASFAEEITVLAGDLGAAAVRVTDLEATAGDQQAHIQQVETAMTDGYDALAELISALSVGNANAFDHTHIWHFDDDAEGWTGSNGDPVSEEGWLTPAEGSNLISPAGLAVNARAYKQVRLRAHVTGSPDWLGRLYWAAEGETWDEARSLAIDEPVWDDGEAFLTWQAAWEGEVDRIRLDLVDDAGATDNVEIDWIAIGRPAPGASSADLLAERQARIQGDAVIAQDVVALEGQLNDVDGRVTGNFDALTALDGRVEDNEGQLNVHTGQITALESKVDDPETGLEGLASAIESLETEVAYEDGSQLYQSQAIRALQSAIKRVAAQGIEGAAVSHEQRKRVREYIATAEQYLNTRIDVTDAQVEIVAEAVTLLQAEIPGLATSQALQTLTTRLIDAEGEISTNAQAITSLNSSIDALGDEVETKLDASVIVDYYTKTETDDVASSAASSATTSLKSEMEGSGGSVRAAQDAAQDAYDLAGEKGRVFVQASEPKGDNRDEKNLWIDTSGEKNTPKRWNGTEWEAVTDKVAQDALDAANQLATSKADASAVEDLTTRVEGNEGAINAHAGSITTLETQVNDPETGLGGLSDAIDALSSEVSYEDGSQVYQSEAIRALQSAVRRVAAQNIEGAATDYEARERVREYLADAYQTLNTRIDVTDETVNLISEAVTILQTEIPGLATSRAVQILTSQLEEAEGAISSNAESILNLRSTIEDPEDGLPSKLAAEVIQNYYTKAETDGVAESAASQATTTLKSELETGPIKAAQDDATQAFDALASKLDASVIQNYYTRAETDDVAETAAAGATTALNSSMGLLGAAGDNLIPNGRFEDGPRPAGEAPVLWQQWSSRAEIIERDEGGAHNAIRTAPSRYIARISSGGYANAITTEFPAEKDEKFEVSFFYAASGSSPGGDVANRLQFVAADGEALSTHFINADLGSTTWVKRRAGPFTAPEGTAKVVYAGLRTNGIDSGASGYITGITVRRLDPELENKLDASVIVDYYTKTETDDVASSAASSAATSLKSEMEGSGGSVKAAQDAAQSAHDAADTKGRVFYQPSAPTGGRREPQNLWIDTTNGNNTPKRWDGSSWVPVSDKAATDALAAANQLATSKADATAVSALTTRVSNAEGEIESFGEAITSLSASIDGVSADGLFRITTEATPSGALSRIGLKAAATSGEGDNRSAALFLEALSGNKSRALFETDTFGIITNSGTVTPFIVEGGRTEFDPAMIALTGDVRVDGSFKIASSETGARIEQTKEGIVIYDSNGNVRVRIGKLD